MPALEPVDPTRRTVLRGAAVVGGVAVAGGALAACGGGSDATTSSGPGDSSPTTEASKAPAGTDLGAASAIAVGSGKIFASKQVVVTQPTKGDFKAFSAVCTHMGCIVAEIVDNMIVCNCHGSEYSIEDGSVILGPATQALAKKKVTEADGNITVS